MLDKSKFIPHEDWRESCETVYLFKNGTTFIEDSHWVAIFKNQKYIWDYCDKPPFSYNVSISKLRYHILKPSDIEILESDQSEKIWPTKSTLHTKWKLIDCGDHFETVSC